MDVSWIAAAFNLVAGVVAASWFAKTKNRGHLIIAVCFFAAGTIFAYQALR
jgi:hypothetical protein